MNKYGPKAQEKVHEALKKMEKGELKMGHSHRTVRSRKQAIAIGLDEARHAGAKVPHEYDSD